MTFFSSFVMGACAVVGLAMVLLLLKTGLFGLMTLTPQSRGFASICNEGDC